MFVLILALVSILIWSLLSVLVSLAVGAAAKERDRRLKPVNRPSRTSAEPSTPLAS